MPRTHYGKGLLVLRVKMTLIVLNGFISFLQEICRWFVLFESVEHFVRPIIYVILICLRHLNKKKMVSCQFWVYRFHGNKRKIVTAVYRKPTSSVLYTHFNILLTAYKFGMIYTLAYHCFKLVLIWQNFMKNAIFWNQYI